MRVSITKSGFRAVDWDSEAGAYIAIEVRSYVSQLRSVCTIEPGVTLAEVFAAVDSDSFLKNFLADYSWCDMDAFHAEAQEPVAQARNPQLECIEVAKYINVDADRAGETLDVSGIGEPYGEGRTQYGIDLTPVNELAALPVRLNPVVEVWKDDELIAHAPASFTLLEVLGEIYYEISFHGSPARRDALMSDLLEAAEAVEDGTAELIPLEAIRKETIH